MGLFSMLFGGKKKEPLVDDRFRHVRGMVEDDDYQLGFCGPSIRDALRALPACDEIPGALGPFGFTDTNPIPLNGLIGQLAYFSKLETDAGQRILFHRLGVINMVDVWEAVTFDGSEWFIFFSDPCHPRRSRKTPEGFRFTSDFGQFSGFPARCQEFPYDFASRRAAIGEGLRPAYIATRDMSERLQPGVFARPEEHRRKIELVSSRLTGQAHLETRFGTRT